ncbi:class I SAM-dependent methyltransferase [Aureimonas populi]|uniref:Class I SAM-dependent methyltransferase n=1 Tax=Aureimonas populi TaxID=1701758 RepID=A0ABW5CL43_9HYPH|nr:methyltransferase domain-containing protein [Aureimonas populi]
MERIKRIRSLFDTSGVGLEIGASYNPILRKSDGFNVKIVDHADADALKYKYRNVPGSDKIEEVDYVSDGRSLIDLINLHNYFDFIIASHVVEHVPDVVSFLNDCHSLLNASGVLVLAVPDKRFCFDVFRPVSTVGEAYEAYMQRRTRHSAATLIDDIIYSVRKPSDFVWVEKDTADLCMRLPESEAHAAIARTRDLAYNDAHGWCFTPSSFRFLIEKLNMLGIIKLRVLTLSKCSEPIDQHEFLTVLSNRGDASKLDDIAHLQAIEDDLREIRTPGQIAAEIEAQKAESERIRVLQDLLHQAERDRQIALEQVAAAEAEVARIRSSKTWRYTETARNLYARMRRS